MNVHKVGRSPTLARVARVAHIFFFLKRKGTANAPSKKKKKKKGCVCDLFVSINITLSPNICAHLGQAGV